MAEKFNNYLTSRSYNLSNTQILVPKAGQNLSGNGTGSRAENAISQIHSIYVTKHVSADYSNDPLAQKSIISLSVVDTSANKEYFIANNVMVLPHSSFYIEKAITLLPQQQLKLTYSNITGNPAGVTLSTVCSSVDIV